MTTTVKIQAGHKGADVLVTSEWVIKKASGEEVSNYSSAKHTLPPLCSTDITIYGTQNVHVSEPEEGPQ
jgi:hypothetical protein